MNSILGSRSSIVSQYLRELRDVEIQKDSRRFEANLERLGIIAAYELSKTLDYTRHKTKTALGTADTPVLVDDIVLATILRAGLPVQRGVHKVFDAAALAFVGAARAKEDAEGVSIDLTYTAGPSLKGKTLIIADTMLATGSSLLAAHRALVEKYGRPSKICVIGVIASRPGLDLIQLKLPKAEIIICALDEKLNDKHYIVPGLGDAGDLLYGEKER
jgi:uracil phosphoribosyltransferase